MPRILKNPKLKVMQRCIGFKFYHMDFFNNHPEFKPDKYCCDIIDEQIRIIDPVFWDKIEKLKNEIK
jgi:hypothetical protein